MKPTLLLSAFAFALAGFTYAGPSDAAAFAIRHAQLGQNSEHGAAIAGTDTRSEFKWVASSNGKGGTVLKPERVTDTINIALVKASKGASCGSGACCSAKK